MRRSLLVVFLLVVLGLPITVGLIFPAAAPVQSSRYPRTVRQIPGEQPMIGVDPRDAEMNRAIARARRELPAFIAKLKSPRIDQSDFKVKARFHSTEVDEHIWIDPVVWRDGKFVGEISNTPQEFPQYHFGQEVTIDPSDVTDWEYLEGGELQGGYTRRVVAGDIERVQGARP